MIEGKENFSRTSHGFQKRYKSIEKPKTKNSSVQILNDIINEASQESKQKKPSIKEIKLQQGVVFLNKKIEKQSSEIILLSEELKKMKDIQSNTVNQLNMEKQKTRKYQVTINSGNKNLAEVKKRLVATQHKAQQQQKKREELENKLMKYKELLRKKEQALDQANGKTQIKQNNDGKIQKQRQQISVLREQFFKVKQKQDDLEAQNMDLKDKLQKLNQTIKIMKQQSWLINQRYQRLQVHCAQIERLYYEQQNQTQILSMELKKNLAQREQQLSELRNKTQRLTQLKNQGKDGSVYGDQVTRILKKHILDKNLKNKISKEILQVISQMEQGWYQILMKSMATYMN